MAARVSHNPELNLRLLRTSQLVYYEIFETPYAPIAGPRIERFAQSVGARISIDVPQIRCRCRLGIARRAPLRAMAAHSGGTSAYGTKEIPLAVDVMARLDRGGSLDDRLGRFSHRDLKPNPFGPPPPPPWIGRRSITSVPRPFCSNLTLPYCCMRQTRWI